MAKARKYPIWFSVHCKPRAPAKPNKMISGYTRLRTIRDNYCNLVLADLIKEGVASIRFSVDVVKDYGNYSGEVSIYLYTADEEVPNPKYDELMEVYKKEYAEYRNRLKLWSVYKKQAEDDLKKKQLERKLAQYKKLKAEFEKEEPEYRRS